MKNEGVNMKRMGIVEYWLNNFISEDKANQVRKIMEEMPTLQETTTSMMHTISEQFDKFAESSSRIVLNDENQFV